MKGIIRILIVALAVAGADVNGWMAMAQEKQITGMEQGAQKTPDHNDILRSCKELRRSGEFKKAVDEGIRYIAAGGEDSLAVVMDVLTTDVEYSEAILRGKISGDPGNIILWRAILSLFYSQTENYRMALKETLKMKWMLNGTGALAEYIGGYYYKLGMPEDAVAELEKKQNDFRTIVVDLLEDVYESCRVYICDRQGWKHESDDSFRAWDMVRSEFLNTLKRLVNLDYENIILISHEDRSRDLTRKGGDKISSIKPNLQDKVANKVAGMVDLVARIVADDDERVLSFKTSEVIFGGGRLTVRDKEIPLTYDAFCEVYEEANQKAAGAVKRGGNTPATPAPETTDTATTAPSRRGRKAKTATPPPADNYDPAEDAAKAACGDPDGTWTPGGGEQDDSVSVAEPATGDTPPWNDLPKCPDGERIFRQHDQNPEIPLCPSIDAGHRCHKEGGPDGCPLWDRPKAQAEEPAPKTDANPPRRTRKKREE